MNSIRSTVVVITALGVEFQAVRAALSDVQVVWHKDTSYEQGEYAAGTVRWRVVLAEVGVGNDTAAVQTERAISYFSPDFVFFVGVAGGVKDVALGDVVVASKVCSYESGADDRQFRSRAETLPASYALVEKAKYLARGDRWSCNLPSPALTSKPRVHVAGIAAGSKVVKSRRSQTAKVLRANYGDVVAVEMEGAGFLRAVHANAAKALVIRGISDLLDKKAAADAKGWQPRASANAAAFLFAMLDLLAEGTEVDAPVYIRLGTVAPTLLNAELLTQSVTIRLLDALGSKARIEKRSTLRAAGKGLRAYVDNLSADGEIEGFQSWPDRVDYVLAGAGGYLVLTRFDEPIASGDKVERTLSADLVGSFVRDSEDWSVAAPFPSSWIELTVEFPVDRRCREFDGFAVSGHSKVRTDVQPTALRDGAAVMWRIAAPDPQVEYQLAWRW